MGSILAGILLKHAADFIRVVPFNKERDKLLHLNLTAENTKLTDEILNDTNKFSKYISDWLSNAKAVYGIGGYDEHRTIYSRSAVFNDVDEPRRLHLGTDIWGNPGTPIFAPLNGAVHSMGFNNNFGDYGATIILQHQLGGIKFHTLYGHLSKLDIGLLNVGDRIIAGQEFAHFGPPEENGYWPPHLHFQIVENMGAWVGDYPGVCKYSARETYLANSPDPDLILQMMQFAKAL